MNESEEAKKNTNFMKDVKVQKLKTLKIIKY